MSKALTILLSVSFSSLLAQAKSCGKDTSTPTEAYEAFAQAASEGDCDAVYAGLDRTSQARLTAGLESLLSLAVAAQDHDEQVSDEEEEKASDKAASDHPEEGLEAGGEDGAPKRNGIALESLSGKPLGPIPVPGVTPPPEPEPVDDTAMPPDPWEVADGSTDDEREQLKQALVSKYRKSRDRERVLKRRKLKKLKGKALFMALCSDKPPPLTTLFRERGITAFKKQPIASESIDGNRAELEIDVPEPGGKNGSTDAKKKDKKAKKKDKGKKGAKKGKGEASSDGPPPIALVREDEAWRVVLDDLEVDWRRQADGRWLPLLSSAVLAVAVETNLEYSPSRAYARIRKYIRDADCEAFYDNVDHHSKTQVDKVAPMVIGLTNALDTDLPMPESGKALLMSLCDAAPYQGMRLAGVLLGPPKGEQIEGSEATVTIRPVERERGSKAPDPTILMVREDGRWKLRIDTLEMNSPFWQKQAQQRKAEAEAKAKAEEAAKIAAEAAEAKAAEARTGEAKPGDGDTKSGDGEDSGPSEGPAPGAEPEGDGVDGQDEGAEPGRLRGGLTPDPRAPGRKRAASRPT